MSAVFSAGHSGRDMEGDTGRECGFFARAGTLDPSEFLLTGGQEASSLGAQRYNNCKGQVGCWCVSVQPPWRSRLEHR